MAISVSDIEAMGFTPAMYGIDDATLSARIEAVIAAQSDQLELRVGAAAFAATANARAVDAALKLLCAIEMAWRRIISLSGNTQIDAAEASEADSLRKAIARWDIDAEKWIARISSGHMADGAGFSSGVTVSQSGSRLAPPATMKWR